MAAVEYRPLAAAPELQQDWQDKQHDRDVTWPELFFDLFFVAAVSNLSHLFDKAVNAPNAGRVLLYHAIVFFIWSDYVTLKTRYRLRGLLYRCIGLALQLGTLGVIIGIRDDVTWHRLLAGGYAVARAATFIAHSIIAHNIPRARTLSLLHVLADGLLLLLGLTGLFLPHSSSSYSSFITLFVGVALIEALVPVAPSLLFPGADVPLHVEHMSERLGQLIMMHLGEAVIGFAMSPLADTVPQFVGVGLAATLVWCLHLCYYHIQPDQHSHAYRQSRARGMLFYYCHWPLAVALLMTGASLRLILGTYPSPDPPAAMPPIAALLLQAAGPPCNAPFINLTPSIATSQQQLGIGQHYSRKINPAAAVQQLAAAFVPLGPQAAPLGLLPGQASLSGLSGPCSLIDEAAGTTSTAVAGSAWAPAATFELSLMLCIAYAASLHLLALIRATHYFSFDPGHKVVKFYERQGVGCWWKAWWCMLWLWPLPVYFLPLALRWLDRDDANGTEDQAVQHSHISGFGGQGGQGVTVTVLLGMLTAHAVVLTCAESVFAHKVTKTSVWKDVEGEEDDPVDGAGAPAGPAVEDQQQEAEAFEYEQEVTGHHQLGEG